MSCETLQMPGGVTAIVCTARRARPRCAVCGLTSTRLCDRVSGKGTCSKPLCDRHAIRDGELDLCPMHARPDAVPVVARLVDLHETLRRSLRRPKGAPAKKVEQLELRLGARGRA